MTINRQTLLQLAVPMAWLLSAVLMGCASDDGAGEAVEAASRPIVFSVSSDTRPDEATRGAVLNSMSGTFGLLGAQYTGDWSTGHEMNFMYNEAVWGSGTDWQTSRGYFAPASTYNLKFFAYYPYCEDITTGADPIVMTGASMAAAPSFTYTMPQDAEEQQDLMYAISEQVKANEQGRMDTIRLQFRHLLTAVTIAAGECSEPGYIRRVTLTNLYYKGTFDYDETAIVTDVNYKRDCWADLDLRCGGVGSGYQRPDVEKSFLLLPQRSRSGAAALHSTAELQVQYEAAGHTITFTLSLDGLKEQLATPGRNILLRLSVTSLQRMSVKAEISDWVNGGIYGGAVSDQPPIDLGTAISDWTDEAGNTTNIVTGPQPY